MEIEPGKINIGIKMRNMNLTRNLTGLKHGQTFEDASHGRSCFQVPYMTFDTANGQRRAALPTKGIPYGLGFNGVTDRCACAVGFKIGHSICRTLCLFIEAAQKLFLSFGAGKRDTLCSAVAIAGAGTDHSMNAVTTGEGFRKRLKHKDCPAFGSHITVT